MNQKVLVAFLLVAVSAVLARPGIAREDALVPAVIAADAVRAPEEPVPAVPVPEEQPTSPAALLDDATAEAVTLPAEQEGSLPAAEIPNNDNIVVPNAVLPVV